jgi:tellurite methyltransferase
MIRTIVGFQADPDGEWVAGLSCHHRQHVRHRPPFQERAWVLDAAGRGAHVGTPIECPLCDRAELPEGLTVLGRGGPWDQDSLPPGLLRAHRTAEGRWGRLRVLEGSVDFQFEAVGAPLVHLAAPSSQVIPPGAPHHLVLAGAVRLELEFWGPSAAAADEATPQAALDRP